MFNKLIISLLLLNLNIANILSKAINADNSSISSDGKAPVFRKCQKPGQFVLTFDDGPNPDTTPIALETLKKYDIKATFFVNGINYGNLENDERSIDILKKTYAEGHDIGSHTYYHKDLFEVIKEGSMENNIDKLTETINNIIGVKPAFFRPPCGNGGYDEKDPERKAMTEKIQKYLGSRGYNIIMWGTDTRDWEFKENVDKVINELNLQLKSPGVSPKTDSFITLLHDVHPTTVNTVLPAVIEYIQKLGYTFVPLSECIGVSPYQGVPLENKSKQTNNNLQVSSNSKSTITNTTTNSNSTTTTTTNNNNTKAITSDSLRNFQKFNISITLILISIILFLF